MIGNWMRSLSDETVSRLQFLSRVLVMMALFFVAFSLGRVTEIVDHEAAHRAALRETIRKECERIIARSDSIRPRMAGLEALSVCVAALRLSQ